MLEASGRADHDEAAVLRLDPLMLAGAQADELGLLIVAAPGIRAGGASGGDRRRRRRLRHGRPRRAGERGCGRHPPPAWRRSRRRA